jgi:glycosyltransferase involved in cell wall biosynthesis
VSSTASYSIVILTQDEALNIADCLRSCAACDDVHVLDSGSTDATRELAAQHGATVHEHPFESFGKQRNWAIDNIDLRHEWVLHLDADERLTPELDTALRAIAAGLSPAAGYLVPNKLIFMGRWLKRAGGYPTYQMRFFHRHRMRFVDYGHGQREQEGTVIETLDEPYLHLAFSKGLDDWFAKHNRYSSAEASEAIEVRAEPIAWNALLTGRGVARRRALKALAYRLPFRPQLRWVMMAIVHGGILEGRAGLTYISLVTTYERMTAAKLAWLDSDVR